MDIKLNERIKIARNKKGLTQTELAELLNIAHSTLNKYEKGHRVPNAPLVSQMAKILNCNPGWLLTGEGEMERAKAARAAEVEGREPQGGTPGETVVMDKAILEEVIKTVDEVFEEDGLYLVPAKKAKLILEFYDYIMEGKITREQIKPVLKLVHIK